MKKTLKKIFVFLFLFILMGNYCTLSPLQVLAADASISSELKIPQVVSKTDTSITLTAEETYEYALQVKKENTDNAEKTEDRIWQWAKEEQYDRSKNTVVFNALTADTEYTFTYRIKGTPDKDTLPELKVRTSAQTENNSDGASSVPPVDEPKDNTDQTQNNDNKGEPSVPPVDESKDNTDQTQNNDNKDEPSVPPIDESKDNTDQTQNNDNKDEPSVPPIDESKDNTDQTQNNGNEDEPSVPPVDESKDNTDQTQNNGNKDEPSVPPVDESKDNTEPSETPPPLAPPEAPQAQKVTDTEIQLAVADSQEYAMVLEGQELTWQTSGTFKNLKPGTDYAFVSRIKKESNVSEPSKPAKITTKFSAAKAPAAPKPKNKSDVMIQVETTKGQEYAMMQNNSYSDWNTTGLFERLTPGTEYKIVTRISFDKETSMPSEVSTPVTILTKYAAAKAPAAPVLYERGETFISIQEQKNVEYAISANGAPWKWQSSNLFKDLKENSYYRFAVREKFDPETTMPSKESPASTFKTFIAFKGSIDGIKANGTYYRDTKLTAKAIGTGMEQTTPDTWDSRWVPRTWSWDAKNSRSWKSAPYEVTFVLDKIGDYTLTVGYELEEYRSGSWKGTGQTKTNSISFKAVLPVYTITSSAGKYGSISPSGTLEVTEGTTKEFFFTPNKEYKVSKVLVDGKQVAFKDNKYTFSNIKSNHTISVSFERMDGRNIPKTGDESPVFLYVIFLAAAIIVLLLIGKKQLDRKRK